MKKIFMLLLLVFSSFTIPMVAQTDRATLTGTVRDPSGRVIVGANLIITDLASGVQQKTITDRSGIYVVTSLATDLYRVTVSAQAFTEVQFEDVNLNVGQTRTLDTQLPVAGGVTEVKVQAGSGLSRSDATIGGDFNGKQATDIPTNGRNYFNLLDMIPGALDAGKGGQQDIRFAGLSDEDNTWHLDGVDDSGINNPYVDVSMHLQVSTEALAQVAATGVGYSADQGGSPGGHIEAASKTGGDKFHGSAWEFISNNIFDATPWGATTQLPGVHYNDFGGNLGGPIMKKRNLFFFANYEGSRQNINQVLAGIVPTPAYKAEVAAQQPGLAPLIDAFPAGSVDIDPVSMRWFGSGPSVTDENSYLGRVDWHINNKMSAYARFNYDAYTSSHPDAINPLTAFHNESQPSAVIDVQNTFSPRLLNDFKFGFNRDVSLEGQNTQLPFELTIPPFTTLDTDNGTRRNDNTYSFVDNFTFLRGAHTIKAGYTFMVWQENAGGLTTPDWEITYNSTQTFLLNQINSDYYKAPNPVSGKRLHTEWAYVLDQFNVTRTLTMNVGLRYEYFGVDHGANGGTVDKGVVVDVVNCPNVVCPSSDPWYYPDRTDFSPRVSLAWAPAIFHNKTVIRAGFGIYYGNGQFGSLGNPPGNTVTSYELFNVSYPPPEPQNTPTVVSADPEGTDIHRKDVANNEYTMSIQQLLARRLILQVAYFGNEVEHEFDTNLVNPYNPATGLATYPAFSIGFEEKFFNEHSNTNALQVGLHRDYATGLQLAINYQYSHSIGNGSLGGGESNHPQNPDCLPCERSSTAEDMRHSLTASTVWQVPVGKGRALLGSDSHWLDQIVGGWQLGGIGYVRSGQPINISMSRPTTALPNQINSGQRPNRVPGVSLYPQYRTTGLWLNPAAFSVPFSCPSSGPCVVPPGVSPWGDLGHNAAVGPGHWQMDAALQKQFPIARRIHLILRAEAFNVLNVAQYGSPATKWAPPQPGVSDNPDSLGLISSSYNGNPTGTGTPRELQFSAKLTF